MADPFPPNEARERRLGVWVSGVAHTLMIGAVALGGALFRAPQAPAVRMAPVETMSASDFEAMAAASRGAGPVGDEASATPAQPRAPSDEVVAGGPVAMAPPVPNADPTALPAPDVSGEAAPNLSDLLVPQTPVAVATVAPAPQQPSAETDDAMAEPQIAAARPRPPAPAPALVDQPAPAIEQPQVPPSPPALTSSRAPFEVAAARQRLADRQAAAEAAQAEAARQEAARQDAARAEEQRLAAEAAARAEAARAAADAAAAQEAERAEAEARAREQAERQAALETEARAAEEARRQAEADARAEAEREAERQAARNAEREAERRAQQERRRAEEEAAAAAAVAALARTEQEAERARAAAEAREQAEAPRAAPDEPDALTRALEQAMADQPEGAGADGGGGRAAQGPPLSQGEKDGLRLQIEACWNIGSLSREAQRTSVTVEFEMTPDGMPEPDSVRMVGSEGGSDAAAAQAFEAARRAILRCALQKDGYRLPSEKYARWRQTIIDFRPQGGPSIR